ncbi:MAG: leucine-rich repeat protein [Clostridiales bacterium]|nr:leucine-rich repeat protein [Clostridiales bacterium]
MCKFKRPLSIILSVLLILSSVPLTTLTASAETTYTSEDGYLKYTVMAGEATIHHCDTSISGDYEIPSTLGGYPVTCIGGDAFGKCTSLTSVVIPDSVTGIFLGAFSDCPSLTSVTIGDSVTKIGWYAFFGTALTSITIPDSVTSIGYQAFAYCTSLTSVTIPAGVTTIEEYAFGYIDVESEEDWSKDVLLDGFTIYGYTGSAAETYANENSITFISLGEYTEPVDISVDDLTVEKGKYLIVVTDISGNPIEGATVQWNSKSYTTDSSGFATVTKGILLGQPSIKITKDGYAEYTNENINYEMSDTGFEFITLYTVSESKYKLKSAIYSDDDTACDVLTGTKVIYDYASVSSFGNTATDFKLYCVPSSTSGVTSYCIYQGDTKIASSSNGIFSLTSTDFEIGSDISCRVYFDDDKYVETHLNIEIKENKSVDETTVKFSDGKGSITIDSDVPFIGGSEISLDIFPELPVYIKKEGNSVSVGVNIKFVEESTGDKDDDDDSGKWEKRKKEIKQAMTDLKNVSGYTIDSTLKSKLDSLMASKKKANFSALGKFDITLLGYLEGKWNDSGFTEASGDIYLVINCSVGATWQTVVVAVPVVINLNVSTKGKVGGEVTYSFEDNTLSGDITCTLTPKIEAAGGVGVAKVVGVQAYGSADLPIEYQIIGTTSSSVGVNSIELTGELGIKAYFAWFEYKKTFAHNTWNIYTRTTKVYSARLASVIEEGGTNTDVYDTDNYTVSDLSYLEDQSQWLGEKKLLRSSASTTNEFKSLLTNTYRNTEPVVATDGENTVMAWIGADETRTDYNAPCVYYSVYDSTADSWSSPQTVGTDSTLDSTPYLYGADGEIYLIYADSLTEFDENSDVSDFTSNQSIAVSKFNAEDGTFSEPVRIDSSEGSYVSVPQITVVNGNAVAVWQECDTDDVFGLCDTNKIMYSVLSGDTWSTPAAAAENLTSVVGLDAGSLDGTNILISYITDGDNDLSTTDDRTLYTVDTEGSTEETAAGTVSGVQFAVMPDTDAMSVVWYDSGNIGVLDSSSEVRYLYEESVGASDEFTVLSDRIIYTGASDGSSNIYALIYNGTSWNSPIALTEQDEYVTSLSAAEADGKVIAAAAVKSITITEEEVEDKCDLCYIILADETSVSIDSVYVEQNDVLPGGKTAVNIDISNKGGTVIDELTFILKDSGGNEVDSVSVTDLAINPGETQTVETSVTVPDTLSSAEEFTFEIECSGDNDTSDNEFSIAMGYSDLSVYAEKIRIGNRWFVAATVTNESNIPAGGTLEIYTPADDTEAAKTVEIETLENGGSKFVQFEITEEILGGTSGSVTVTAVSDKDEYFDYNNSEQLYYDLEYDILPESISLSSTEITVKEGGSKALIAAVLPENCADPSVIYASADPAIAAVDEDGNVTGVSVGTTTVTVMTVQGGFTAECAVTVEHDYVETSIIEPTCEAAGYTVHTCSVCGDTYTDSETAALGHNYTSVITAATCTEDGYTTYTCTNCGKSYISDETPATGHSYTSVTTAATCTEDGSIVYTCSACGDTYMETISASGHSYGEWVVTVEPDYEIEGERQRTCTVCGNAETETIAPLDDTAADDPTVSCTHFCHSESSFIQLFYKIIRFLWKIFGINQYCECGEAHW